MEAYKTGAILKIEVTNFIIYSYAELHPGPQMNMIIGPNGSGKSTMVAAIILGLGGSPKTVGRGSNISEYVKNFCDEATIRIHLKSNDECEVTTVTRKISKNGHTTWLLNDVQVSQKQMLAFVSLHRIQVDNLCQFLPQDRVVEFAKMNKQELLKQTLLALDRVDLINDQKSLTDKRDSEDNLMRSIETLKKRSIQLNEANDRLEGRVTNFLKKKKIQNEIDDVARKFAWLLYFESISNLKKSKTSKATKRAELEGHLKVIKPIEDALREKRGILNKSQEAYDRSIVELKNLDISINKRRNRIPEFEDQIKDAISEKVRKLNEIKESEVEMDVCQKRVNQLKQDRVEISRETGTAAEMLQRLKKFDSEIETNVNTVNALQSKKTSLNERKREHVYEINSLESKLQQVENRRTEHLNVLRQLDQDAYRATLWIRNNKHLFKGTVYEPLMLEINVNNAKHAIYIENSISLSDKVAFTCTTKDDMNLLIRTLRGQMKLVINVLYSSAESKVSDYKARTPIEQLRRYGFYSYLIELCIAPEPIKVYLCKMYGMHRIPVADRLDNRHDLPEQITKYYVGKSRVSMSISKYSKERSTMQVEIKSDGTISIGVDVAAINSIQGKIAEIQRTAERHENEIHEINRSISNVQENISKIKEHIQKIETSKYQISNIDGRIKTLEMKLNSLQMGKSKVKLYQEDCRKQIESIKNLLLQTLKEIQISYKEYTEKLSEYELSKTVLNLNRKSIYALETESSELRATVTNAEAALTAVTEEFERIKAESVEKQREAKKLSDNLNPADEGFKKYKKKYEELPDTLDQLTVIQDNLNSKLDCLVNMANDGEMREYETTKNEIAEIQKQIETREGEIERFKDSINDMEKKWLEPLEELVEKISAGFTETLIRMGVVGQVDVYKGETEKDYEEYGLSIKVTFRTGAPLQELNSHTQSGGERSVATAAFMLALQELTPAPFRCVDEINQGMDATNERRIFECIVDITGQEHSAQYFLITPKLVPNLKFGSHMKIHFVHNGPFVVHQKTWNESVMMKKHALL